MRTDEAFQAMTKVAVAAEVASRVTGGPRNPDVTIIRDCAALCPAPGYYAKFSGGVVRMVARRPLPRRVFDYL